MNEDKGYEVIPDDDPLLVGDADEPEEEGAAVVGAEPATETEAEPPVKEGAAVESEEHRDDRIPRARFDELHGKYKQADERVKALEAALAATERHPEQSLDIPADLKEMKKEAIRLLLEGEDDAAADVEMKIFQAQQQAFDARVEEATTRKLAERDAARETKRANNEFNLAVAEIESKHPELDINSAAANHDAIEMVISLRDKYIGAGQGAAEALISASAKVAKTLGLSPSKNTDTRMQAAVRRNADEAGRQPAMVEGGMGNRAANSSRGVPNDPREWAKLPKEEQDRLLQ
jgi:hypothetical protein